MARLRIAGGIAGLALAGAAAAGAALPAPVTLDGVGGVVPGLTPAQVQARWGVPVRPGAAEPGGTCREARIVAGPVRGVALFLRGRLGAVFFDRGARTPSGIAIGSTETALRRAYGNRLAVTPHKYVRGGHYLFLTRRSAPHWQIRFDTNARGRVTQIGFGTHAAVSLVEGCL